jgi:hypothetical protein
MIAFGKLVVPLAVLAAEMVGAAPSSAGTYVIRSCDVPGQSRAPLGPWRSTPAPNMVAVDACAAGDGFSFAFPGPRTMPNFTRASLGLAVPTDGAIGLKYLRVWGSASLTGKGIPIGAGSYLISSLGRRLLIGLGTETAAAETPIEASPSEATRGLEVALTCEQSDDIAMRARLQDPVQECNPDDASPMRVRGLEVTLQEDVPPSGAAVGGTLLASDPGPIRTLDYTASDHESGLLRIEAVIDDKAVAARDLSVRCSYADYTACPTADRDSLTVDTRSVADGHHALVLRISDAAGNHTDEPAGFVDVQNRVSVPGDAAATPAIGLAMVGPTQLTARFATSSDPTLTVPFGRRLTVRGRLSGAAGAGVGEARIDVFERSTASRAKEVMAGSATTRADGTFSYVLAGTGPSRTVRLAYGSLTSSGLLKVRVRAASTLEATLHGTLVRYSGQVLSRPIPGKGKRVALEGKAPGFKWTSFVATRTDRQGRFSGRYRLPVRRPGVKLQIRAVVPTERGYPYLGYVGKPVVLRVH